MNKATSLIAAIVVIVLSVSFIKAGPSAQSAPKHAMVLDSTTATVNRTEQLASIVPSLSKEVLEYALKGYNKLLAEGAVSNSKYLTIVDMSQSSREKRFYMIDMEKDSLVMNTYVAHGKKSGVDKAQSFSNVIGSEQSSLGFYVTKQTYTGKHGLSLKLRGMEKGFNDNAEPRAVVVHGADYVNEGRVRSAYMGRSQGCPALPNELADDAINLMKDGSALFIYSADKNYTEKSSLLN
jgi:hypothetical protein